METPPQPAKRGYLVPGTIALVVIGGIAAVFGIVGLTSHAPGTLGGPLVAQRIGESLQSGPNPPGVTCPPEEPVRAGLVFSCTLHRAGGGTTPIRVTETGHGDFRYAVLGR